MVSVKIVKLAMHSPIIIKCVLFTIVVVFVVSVSFDQPSYTIRENNNLELTLVLSDPLGCNCYTSIVVKTDDMEATGE